MIKVKKEGSAVAAHPSGKKQVNPEFSIETTGTVNTNDVKITIQGGKGTAYQPDVRPLREERKGEENYYSLTFEALVDNIQSDVEIIVTVKNENGEEDSEVLTIPHDPYSKRT